MSRCDWVSPHIAGHSIKARENGSDLLAAAVARWAGVEAPALVKPMDEEGSFERVEKSSAEPSTGSCDVTKWMTEFLSQQSILPREDARLRGAAKTGLTSLEFDQLRKAYQQPAEWTGQRATIARSELRAAAERVGLKVVSE